MSSQERRATEARGVGGTDRRERARCLIEQYRSVVGNCRTRFLASSVLATWGELTQSVRQRPEAKLTGAAGYREPASLQQKALARPHAPPPQPPQTGFEEEAQGARGKGKPATFVPSTFLAADDIAASKGGRPGLRSLHPLPRLLHPADSGRPRPLRAS